MCTSRLWGAVCASILSVIAASVQAANLTFDYSGVYPIAEGNFISPDLQERFGTAGTFTGSITIQDGITDINPDSNQGEYLDAITAFSLTLNPGSGTAYSVSETGPFNNFKITPGNDAIGGATNVTGTSFDSGGKTWSPDTLEVSFVKAGVLTDDTLDLATLQGFYGATLGTLEINFYSATSTIPGTLRGSVTSVSAPEVPVPAALWLFGSGLLGLLGISSPKKSA